MSQAFFSLNGALFAEFERPEQARHAFETLRALGYAKVESHSPFPLTAEQRHRPGAWHALGITVFALALTGAIAGYVVQWYANAYSYPLDIGGRPAHAVPAFILPTFEAAVLFGGVATFVGVLVALRLPRLWRPVFEIDGAERISNDRFWVAVGLGSGGGEIGRTKRELIALRAVRVVHVVGEP